MSEAATSQALRRAIEHLHAGRLQLAETLFREVMAGDPACIDAVHSLGVIALQRGQHTVALELIRQAAALAPDNASIHSNLGETYRNMRRFDEAVASFSQALALQPEFPIALNNLGNALAALGRLDEAVACCRRALALQPGYANAENNLGICLTRQGKLDEAIACFRRALVLKPDFTDAHNNLGNVFKDRGQLDEAIASVERALALKPDFADAHNNLGNIFKDRGQLDEGIACYRRALALKPDRPDIHSNLILALQYRFGDEPEVIGAELRRWNEQHARPLAGFSRPHANDRSPQRRLRIGYVSPDFWSHSVAFFLLPLLHAHNHGQFHITAYAANTRRDDVTSRLQACTDTWRSLAGVSDEEAARLIREDRIDLLIDLSGHTAGNCLMVFARRPAPIQISYLGYPGATGLEAIDYRLTDPWVDPPSEIGNHHDEQLVRLPETAWCFTPLMGHPSVGELPATRHGYVTFGCFNNFAKITDEILYLWVRILQQVPRSRLTVKNLALRSRSVVQRLHEFFENRGIASDRVALISHQNSPLDHLESFDRVDLGLDTFPYHGTTTTCESLWMGVPVITLTGRCHVARVGASLLTNVGLPELVTGSPDAYVESAVATARDLVRLATLRAGLRERMQRSPLMDAPRFARNVETAYRTMWQRWCAQPAPASVPTR